MKLTDLSTEQIRDVLDGILRLRPETYLYAGLTGNAEVIRAAYKGAYDGSPQSFRNIFQTALDCIKQGQLRINPRYAEAFQEAFRGDAAQKSGIGANEQMIITELVARRLDCTAENIRALIGELWDQLDNNREHTQQQFVSNQRARRIAEMTNNGTCGFTVEFAGRRTAYNSDGTLHDPMAGQARGLSMGLQGAWSRGAGSKSFEDMTNEEVDAIYQAWRTSTDMRNMSREDLRKLVRANGKTDLFNKSVRAPDSTPDPTDRLYHPTTGEAFTQRSLIKYINNPNDPYCGRRLITHPASGKVIPRLKVLFEKTIRGDFEDRP